MRQPTFIRYARVESIISEEGAFVARLSPKTEVVLRPDGAEQMFSPEIIRITQAIHDAGKDAYKVNKVDVIRAAIEWFKIGAQPTPAPAPAPEQKAQPVQVAKAEPAPTPSPSEPADSTVDSAPSNQQSGFSKLAARADNDDISDDDEDDGSPVDDNEATEPDETDASGSSNAGQSLKQPVASQERPGENKAAFNAYISMYSMTLTLLQLVELYDTSAGRDNRIKTLDDLAREFNRHTHMRAASKS